MKKLGVVLATILIAGCSNLPLTKTNDTPIKSEFLGGSIKVVYKKSTGEVESIESMATARVISTLPNSVDESFTLATMRARKQIIEFMKTEVESEKFTEAIYDTLQKSDVQNKDKNESVNQNIAQKVQQNIRQKSAGILKGTYVSEKIYDSSTKTVKVTVRSGEEDVEAAKKISRLMGN